jgi:predicted CoA-binding protein
MAMTPVARRIEAFLAGKVFAVAGASRDRSKYGNRVLRCYVRDGRTVHPVNPNADEVEGLRCWPDLASVPEPVHGVSLVTPPDVTESVVDDALRLGIKHLWMQPGAESPAAIRRAEAAGASVIAHGPCLLVTLCGG